MSRTSVPTPPPVKPHRPAREEPEPPAPPTRWRAVLAVVLGTAALTMLVLTAFAYPAIHAEPTGVPLVVAGPEPAVEQMSRVLMERVGDDALDISTVSSPEQAQQAVTARQAYGAIVFNPAGSHMLIASAASPAVAQLLTSVAAQVPPQAGGPVPVKDVVALPSADPRGTSVPAAMLPVIVAGIASAALTFGVVRGLGAQAVTIAATSLIAGAGMAWVLTQWLTAFTGSYVALAGAFASGIAAVAVTIWGLARLMGVAGIGLGAMVMMFLGNPTSGATSAPELLPAGWGATGQLLPPGATASLIRSVGYFDGSAAGTPLVVLAGWGLLGLVLAVAASWKGRPKTPE